MNFSKELREMLKTKIGYRNEEYSGSGEANVEKVIKFEICELGNQDIIEFFQKHYGFTFEQDRLENNIESIIPNIMNVLYKKFGHQELSCLWLSTLEGVKENYLCGDEYIRRYDLSQTTFLPISDLGDQGALFVLDTHPDFLPYEELYIKESKESLFFPWELPKEEFESRAIDSKTATKLIQKYRAGIEESKNKGNMRIEPHTEDLVEVLIPMDIFSNEYLSYIEETVDMGRVNQYQIQNIDTPIYVLLSKNGNWVISDGGHRLMAKKKNGKSSIRALVPKSSYDWFIEYSHFS